MTAREVQGALGVSQQRVSQLVKRGDIAAQRSPVDGRMQYDGASVQAYAAERAARKASSAASADERRARQEEAAYRFERERRRHAEEVERRRRWEDDLKERAVAALERIAKEIGK